MNRDSVTLFSWGYKGWGNAVTKLVGAVDAVELSRGWGPPLFVDVRASRKVRAVGFREGAFEKRFGADRYRLMPSLGNEAIVKGTKRTKLIDPKAAGALLELAEEMAAKKRRVIFFCACLSPSASCHRTLVASELLSAAERRATPIVVVEWPGLESQPKETATIKLDATVVKKLAKVPSSIPLGPDQPDVRWLSLPWYSVLRFESPKLAGYLYSGPARFRPRGWELPFQGAEASPENAQRQMLDWQEEGAVLPKRWPA